MYVHSLVFCWQCKLLMVCGWHQILEMRNQSMLRREQMFSTKKKVILLEKPVVDVLTGKVIFYGGQITNAWEDWSSTIRRPRVYDSTSSNNTEGSN